MKKCNLVKITLILLLSIFTYTNSNAQLKKSAEINKVKSFTNGSVSLNKILIDGTDMYCVRLKNNSKHYQPVILYLGDKETMIANLTDLSNALDNGKKGDIFDFSAYEQDYSLAFSKVLGQKCFKVWEKINTTNDFGRFYKATIDDILDFITKE